MTLVIEKFLVCDIQGPGCDQEFGVDDRTHNKSQSVLQARARAQGWLCTSKRDVCPFCLEDEKKGASHV